MPGYVRTPLQYHFLAFLKYIEQIRLLKNLPVSPQLQQTSIPRDPASRFRFVVPRGSTDEDFSLTRIKFLYPANSELYASLLILLERAISSFQMEGRGKLENRASSGMQLLKWGCARMGTFWGNFRWGYSNAHHAIYFTVNASHSSSIWSWFECHVWNSWDVFILWHQLIKLTPEGRGANATIDRDIWSSKW